MEADHHYIAGNRLLTGRNVVRQFYFIRISTGAHSQAYGVQGEIGWKIICQAMPSMFTQEI